MGAGWDEKEVVEESCAWQCMENGESGIRERKEGRMKRRE